MNYRHIYHAGHACDVVKHASLCLLLDALKAKQGPFAVLDTHAGIGLYDLDDPRARQTDEAREGIRRLVEETKTWPTFLESYINVIRDLNGGQLDVLRLYPGSPLFIRHLMRENDRLMACEWHVDDIRDLKRAFRDDKQAQIHHRDGYEALKSLLPPPEKRGLVLIDPPFEVLDEFDRLVSAAQNLHHRWREGMQALWYPIKERPAIWRFHEALRATGIPKILVAEFMFAPESRSDRLNGSGLILINPPWKIETKLADLYGFLHQALDTESAESPLFWLNPDV